jgi:hypothetical protein
MICPDTHHKEDQPHPFDPPMGQWIHTPCNPYPQEKWFIVPMQSLRGRLWLVSVREPLQLETCDCGHTHRCKANSSSQDDEPVWAASRAEAKRILLRHPDTSFRGWEVIKTRPFKPPGPEFLMGDCSPWGIGGDFPEDGPWLLIPKLAMFIHDPSVHDVLVATHAAWCGRFNHKRWLKDRPLTSAARTPRPSEMTPAPP